MRFQDFVKSVVILDITTNGMIVEDPTTGDVFEVNEEQVINQARAEMLARKEEQFYRGVHA